MTRTRSSENDGFHDRAGDRLPFHTRLRVSTADGRPAAPMARTTNVGLGGVRVTAASGLVPGTCVHVSFRLPSGRIFACRGHVAWSKQTLHPTLLGSPRGRDDDAIFGIAFDDTTPQDLMPIARLFSSYDHARRRARRIRRIHGLPGHA